MWHGARSAVPTAPLHGGAIRAKARYLLRPTKIAFMESIV
jgi:hypothetical protein